MIELDIVTEAGDWETLGEAEALARAAVEAAFAVAKNAPSEPVELSLLLSDDAAVQELNRAWRGKDKPTNVLSFPAPEQPGVPGPRHLGDIVLAYETVVREAAEEGKSLHDHVLHLIVHGTLHLLGYDHELEVEAEIMEGLEIEALARLGVANPYRDLAA